MAKQGGSESSAIKKKPSRLGRGLSSLMATPAVAASASPPSSSVGDGVVSAEASSGVAPEPFDPKVGGFLTVEVASIAANPQQPRRRFDEAALQRLADSIRSEGLLQPVVVRPVAADRYELVAGERRWRAAKLAGLEKVPAFVKALDDRQLAEWALIENLQREDLNPIERAEAFQRLGDVFGLNHEQVAERVGLERSTVTNLLRLLKLAPPVREMVVAGTLSMGQSRALAGVEPASNQLSLAEQAVKEVWSVRQVEAAVKSLAKGEAKPTASAKKVVRAAYLDDLERQIAEQLSTKVQIKTARKKGAGTLSIDFYSIDEFDALLEKLGVKTQ